MATGPMRMTSHHHNDLHRRGEDADLPDPTLRRHRLPLRTHVMQLAWWRLFSSNR